MSAIEIVLGRQILDSRGNPTVEADVHLESGALRACGVALGASTGSHEAVELRDGGEAWGGKGVSNAVDYVNGEISDAPRRLRRPRSARGRLRDDRPRRHAQQGSPRRERDPRGLARDAKAAAMECDYRSSSTSAASTPTSYRYR